MLRHKKPKDEIYVVPRDRDISSPRIEIVEKVGTRYVATLCGKEYRVDNGTERTSTQRLDVRSSDTRAWSSKKVYDEAIAHIVKFNKIEAKLRRLKPSDLTPAQLTTLSKALGL